MKKKFIPTRLTTLTVEHLERCYNSMLESNQAQAHPMDFATFRRRLIPDTPTNRKKNYEKPY